MQPQAQPYLTEKMRSLAHRLALAWGRRYGCRLLGSGLTTCQQQLPTTVLECFLMRTAICGFIPAGGFSDILALSNGALREVFIEDRDCKKLAEVVMRVLNDSDLRRRLVEDGWQIVTQHFAAEKIVPEQLVPIYRKVCGHA